MGGTFKATATDLRALVAFLELATEASRQTGVWFCAYGPTEVLAADCAVRVGVDGEGDAMQYVIDDQIGA